MIQSLFRSFINVLKPTPDQSRKRRRTEEEERLGLPPYNYHQKPKYDNPLYDAPGDIRVMEPSSSKPSTSGVSTTSKYFAFKGPDKPTIKENNTDADIQILMIAGSSNSKSAYVDRQPLTSRQNTNGDSQVTEERLERKPRKTIFGPSEAISVFGSSSQSWKKPSRGITSFKYSSNIVQTSTPKRSDFTRRISVSSKAICRNKKETNANSLVNSYNAEEKKQYADLIKSMMCKAPISTIFSKKSATPPLIDLTLNEEEITKSLFASPKPLLRNFPSTPNPFVKPKILPEDDEVEYIRSVPRKNSLADTLKDNDLVSGDRIKTIHNGYTDRKEVLQRAIEKNSVRVNLSREKSKEVYEDNFLESIRKTLSLFDIEKEEEEIPEVEAEEGLPTLPEAAHKIVDRALIPRPPSEVLVSGFNTDILRKDIHTLADKNWLNDEVINFYMELIRERGALDNYPKVHSFNTFFFPKLRQSGFQPLKRWTKKVDIFAHDLVVVPIHLGVHWCMAILDVANKTAHYFDSMLAPNPAVLTLLMRYLEEESMDKKKVPYDTKKWKLVQERNIPQQHNGYDCGVFACMFAESASRRGQFVFTQDDMPDLRRRMVFEILTKKLLI